MAGKADGTVYINTNVDSKGFSGGIDKMKNSVGGLGKAFSKLGVIIGTVFAVKELVRFGKEAIELGSDLQEVQNVVDVTFTTMADKVDEFARNAAKTAGLSETMAKKYAGTFGAMANAFGFAESEAFEMSTTLTQLSGDVASFYNLTQDEAYTKLKSVFTGETESLKDLGVVMTQTALDSYAMAKGFGKTTSQMSEQEKVALRYSFVLDQLSGASGDFQRTSDGWANQMRVLNLNIESLKANIGQGLINLFTPLLIIINQVIEKLSVLGTKFKEFTELIMVKSQEKGTNNAAKAVGKLGVNYGNSADSVDDFSKSLVRANKETKKSLSPLDNLNNLTSNIAEDLQESSLGLSGGLLNMADSSASVSLDVSGVDDISGLELILLKIATSFEKVRTVFENVWTKYLKPIISDFKTSIQSFAGAFVSWFSEKIIPILERLREKFTQVVNEHIAPLMEKVNEILGKVSEAIQLFWNEVLVPFIEWLGEKLGTFLPPFIEGMGTAFINAFDSALEVVGFLLDALSGLIDFIVGVFTGDWETAWNGIMDVFKGIINALIGTFEGFINFIIDSLNALINGANDLGSSVGITWQIPTIPNVEIPKLATGAVIPPNAPFMAMLGDQKHGTNIEAPLDTIKQGLAEVLAEMGINVTFEVEGNEAGIFNVTQRQARMFTKQTGKPAFPTGG